jgi:ArsR family transcriptional regulator
VKSNPTLDQLFAALGDGTRLRLLNLMCSGEVCVCFFVSILGELQPKVSRHLAALRQAGLVEARRDGKWMHYRIVDDLPEPARGIMQATFEALRNDPAMKKDRLALQTSCCATKLPEQLRRAPRPVLGRELPAPGS